MAKSRVLLGAFLGSLVGVGLAVLSFYIADLVTIPLISLVGIAGLGIGGFVAGLIAKTPGKGALAGALTAVVTFIVSTFVIIVLSIVIGQTLLYIITLGQYTGSGGEEILGLVIGIGIAVGGLISLASAGLNAFTGFLGGLVNNPKDIGEDAYQDYPETR